MSGPSPYWGPGRPQPRPHDGPQQVPAAQYTPGAAWHPDPTGQAELRYWDGYQWTGYTHGASPADRRLGTTVGIVAIAAAVLGCFLAAFTSVSVLSGTGTVWTGAGIATVGAVVACCVRNVSVGIRIGAIVLAVLAIGSAAYAEKQVQDRIDQLNQIGNASASAYR